MPSPASKTARSKTSPVAKAREVYRKVPTRTKEDDPGRYSKTPHEYGDVLIMPDAKGRTKLGGTLQRDLVYWIERHTWGKNIGTPLKIVRPEYAKLSLSQLAKLCGSDRRTVARAITDLVARGIIEARDRTGCGSTVAKMYKLTPEKWKRAPYYEAKAMESAELEQDEEEDEETPIPEATDAPEREVSPGRVSKPQAVAVSPFRDAPAIAIRLVYRSVDLPFPVAFRAAPGRNGRVQISCRAVTPQFSAVCSPSKITATVEDNQVNQYSDFLTAFVLNRWGKALDNILLNQIVTAANNAPVAVFERLVTEKFQGTRKHTTGLLISLAGDAGRAWRTELQHRAAEEAAHKPTTAEERAAELAELERAEARRAEEKRNAPPCSTCKGTGVGTNLGKRCRDCMGTGKGVAR